MKKLPALLLFAALTIGAETVKEAFYISPELKEVDIRQIPRRPWGDGFTMTPEGAMCDNGENKHLAKGIGKRFVLNQKIPLPVKFSAESRAENVVTGDPGGYSIHLDILYMDGSVQYGKKALFSGGTHGWERREVRLDPVSPIRSINCSRPSRSVT